MNRRRRLLLMTALAAPIAYIAAKRPSRTGGPHNEYFLTLQHALREAGLFRPTLVVDRQQLGHNVQRLKTNLPKNQKFRIVSKSVPSLGLIREIRLATGSDRLMVFHQPHMNYLAQHLPDTSWLLGKPMPVGAAKRFFTDHKPNAFDPIQRIEWLIDTAQRMAEYRELAGAQLPKGKRLKLNLEVDVGLHRGGFTRAADVAEVVRQIKADPTLEFSGFMGYEAHCSKVPDAMGGPKKALGESIAFYKECVSAAREVLGEQFKPETLTLNMGGSTTYEMYDESAPCNDISVGSALVKPTDFDTKTLADHQPASFIATPVLKAIDHMDLPGYEGLTLLQRAWDPNARRSFYLYGGYWLANAVSPPGLQRNAWWGHSTNQDLLNGSADVQLGVGDYVFFRPHQSEFVFLQFGDIAVYDNGKIVDAWPAFPEGRSA
jgi:D-serine deaminase-like pyridoxal phosphate-dependent protein